MSKDSHIKFIILIFIAFISAVTIGYVVENTEQSGEWRRHYISAVNQVLSKDTLLRASSLKANRYKDSLAMIRLSNHVLIDSVQKLNKKISNYKWQLSIKKDSTNDKD